MRENPQRHGGTQWDSNPGMQHFRSIMAKYYPEADRSESGPLVAFQMSSALVEVIRRCGDDLTHERIMRAATDLDLQIGGYIPGIGIKTSPTDFRPIEHLRVMRFTGEMGMVWSAAGWTCRPSDTIARLIREARCRISRRS